MEQRIADIHSHILPGVDDGSRDMESSLEMLRIAYEQGTRRLFLTPHYMSGNNDYGPGDLRASFAEFRQEAGSTWPDLELYLGNEVYYSTSVLEDLRAGKIETMAESRYVLIEFSPKVSYERLFQAVREITNAGYRVLIAHVERYLCLEKKKDRIFQLAEMGAYFQTNASALVKGKGKTPSQMNRWNRKMVTEGWISFLGSDAHDTGNRAPWIAEAAAWIRKKDPSDAEGLLWSNSDAIINDKSL